jgi:hypothetical protein
VAPNIVKNPLDYNTIINIPDIPLTTFFLAARDPFMHVMLDIGVLVKFDRITNPENSIDRWAAVSIPRRMGCNCILA